MEAFHWLNSGDVCTRIEDTMDEKSTSLQEDLKANEKQCSTELYLSMLQFSRL